MTDSKQRENLYAAPRADLRDESPSRRLQWVEWGCAIVRALLDLVILCLIPLPLTIAFLVLTGESLVSWAIPVGCVAGLVATIWLRQCFVVPKAGAPVRGLWRLLR
ncbi:hypothetical protein OPU71_16835 [Niveibacterium sp. 24ML]|uniref:hypothetical protein n=1 Tax=Niveibacterium sp. 24ML TaxID=2985512 RepID=UPI00226F0A8E|nr:hypothetical protein [Niveibacterium sp. 24ML]MCX9157791.1 hypothetical protein [Niveibacterium sp. 24ML]